MFEINSTIPLDIITAVKIAMEHYKVKAKDLLSNIYVKNLNAENENEMVKKALVSANKELYSSVCKALVEAAREFDLKGELKFWVISNNINPKIPQKELHSALLDGGADSVVTDDKIYNYFVGSNNAKFKAELPTNLHLATIKI